MVFVVGSREMSICTVVESFSTCEREYRMGGMVRSFETGFMHVIARL